MIKNNSLIFGSTGFIGTKVVSYLKILKAQLLQLAGKKSRLWKFSRSNNLKDFNFKNTDLPKIDHVFICLGQN